MRTPRYGWSGLVRSRLAAATCRRPGRGTLCALGPVAPRPSCRPLGFHARNRAMGIHCQLPGLCDHQGRLRSAIDEAGRRSESDSRRWLESVRERLPTRRRGRLMNLIFRPFDMWTDLETRYRKPAPFFSSSSDTFSSSTEKWTRWSTATTATPTSYCRWPLQSRPCPRRRCLDGGIRADAKVTHPGVVITFDGPSGPFAWPPTVSSRVRSG